MADGAAGGMADGAAIDKTLMTTANKSVVLPAPSGNNAAAPSGNNSAAPASLGAAPAPARPTMKRLKGFDYKKPYFYMVTLKRVKGLKPFGEITKEKEPPKDAEGRPRYLVANAITEAFVKVIREFHTKWRGLWPIQCFTVMPDHLHLLVHLKDSGDQLALGKYVYQLMKALTAAYWGMGNNLPPVFERDWHDWIVKKDGQLAAFTRYIRENPERAWLRQQNRRYFGQVRKVSFLGREWFAYGNLAILDLPVLKPVKGHRATQPGSPEWNALVEECARLGPGGVGVSTFMSPLEKACGNAVAAAGGKWVVLSPEGFHDRWHPGRQYERYCAAGRMLFLSLYPVLDRLPTKSELYHRCHEMGDVVAMGMADGTAIDNTLRASTAEDR